MSYRHALCLYPYVVDQRPGIGIFPPTGLEYIATSLQGHVGRITLIDLRHERPLQQIDQLCGLIHREGVDLLCISIGWRARYEKVCQLVARLPAGITTVVGGHQATEQVEDIFRRCPNVDAVVRGEGEQAIAELADGLPWDQILSLSYRSADGSIRHNGNRPLPPLDEISPPDRSLRRARYYPTLRGVRLLNVEFDTILASRGCPYKCEFCSLTMNPLGQKRDYASRSPESVADEIESSSADVIFFADDIFFLEPRKAERLCDLLIERGIKKRYGVQCRIEVFKFPRMLEKACQAGFRILDLGLESASDRILKDMHKGFTTQHVREAFQVLRRFPFWFHGYFIYGNVGETEEEMLAIPRFARELGLHSIGLSLLRIDQFTPWRQRVESTPGYRIGRNGYVYSDKFDKRRLRQIRNRITNDFYYRPAHIARMAKTLHDGRIVTYPQMLRVLALSPLVGWDYLLHAAHKWHRRSSNKATPPANPYLDAEKHDKQPPSLVAAGT
ncbi:MAG TPA: radical SAM protein [Phycisphaerae bacterium]|nr:radical SAM protein [Phycisphaerae bacterium]